MIGAVVEAEILQFVREIISVRAGEPLSVGSRPEMDNRNAKAVEELWEGQSVRYAVEHTRVESFAGQIAKCVTRATRRRDRVVSPDRLRLVALGPEVVTVRRAAFASNTDLVLTPPSLVHSKVDEARRP